MRKLVQTDQKGDTQAHLYDMANRLTESQYRTYGTIGTDGIPTGNIASDIENNAQADFDTFEYDLASRTTKAKKGRYLNVIDYTYDDGGRMVDETITVNTTSGAGKSYSMLHDFDTDSRMTRCTYPDGSQKTNFFTERDEVDKTFYQANLVADMAYDAGYRETSRTYGNSLVTSKSYNDDNTYSSITVAGKTGLSFDYTYDENKNVLSETTGSPMAGYSWTSTYDAKDRLVSWTRQNTDAQSWDLTEVGDWKSNTVNGTTTARGHNAVHEIGNVGASTLTHDAKGNATTDELGRVLNWDFENKLQSSDASSAGGSSSIDFTYDALGRRITKDGTLYAYCGQKVCAEYDVGTSASNPERKFVYGSYIDEPIMLVDADGAGADVDEYYYHCNRQYSVTGLTDDSGVVVERYAYTPYGQTTILAANGTTVRTASSYDNPYMCTGRRIDLEFSDDPETAMYYFRARYYSPTLGRFIGRDPLGYVDGYSLYAAYFAMYWGVDPLGLFLSSDISGQILDALVGEFDKLPYPVIEKPKPKECMSDRMARVLDSRQSRMFMEDLGLEVLRGPAGKAIKGKRAKAAYKFAQEVITSIVKGDISEVDDIVEAVLKAAGQKKAAKLVDKISDKLEDLTGEDCRPVVLSSGISQVKGDGEKTTRCLLLICSRVEEGGLFTPNTPGNWVLGGRCEFKFKAWNKVRCPCDSVSWNVLASGNGDEVKYRELFLKGK